MHRQAHMPPNDVGDELIRLSLELEGAGATGRPILGKVDDLLLLDPSPEILEAVLGLLRGVAPPGVA